MQVELGTVAAFVGTLLSAALGVYVTILRYAVTQREHEIDRRLQHCDAEVHKLSDRLNAEEKSTIRQDGEIRLVQQTHNDVKSDIDEIKRTMVTKAEWSHLEKTMVQILEQLRRSPGGSGQYFPFTKKPDPR